ncbi:MAG: GNAT family N-acetyltransferase [Cyclobacteriaceae bacterium]
MPAHPDSLTVTHQPEKKRFEIQQGKDVAVLEYIMARNFLVFSHTEVPPPLEGQGLASKLARTGLEYAKAQGLQVMPLCPYVAMYIRRHPEYRSLVLPGFHV